MTRPNSRADTSREVLSDLTSNPEREREFLSQLDWTAEQIEEERQRANRMRVPFADYLRDVIEQDGESYSASRRQIRQPRNSEPTQ